MARRTPEQARCRDDVLRAAIRLSGHDQRPFIVSDLIGETVAGGTVYSTDTINRTIRRMRGQRGNPDHAEFDRLPDGRLHLRAGFAPTSRL